MSAVLQGFAAALVDPSLPVPSGVVGRFARTDGKRFAVYRNNVHVSLVEALAKRTPVVRRLVGEEFFRAMARVYVASHKPQSPVLLEYGATFPDFIADFPPGSALPYLADVARLECAWLDAYHAADAAPLALSHLTAVVADRLPDVRFVSHPATRLVSSPHAIGTIWAVHQQADVPPLGTASPETVLVVRPQGDVGLHILPEADREFVAALLAGATIASAAALAGTGCNPAAALPALVGLGAFQSIIEGSA